MATRAATLNEQLMAVAQLLASDDCLVGRWIRHQLRRDRFEAKVIAGPEHPQFPIAANGAFEL
jgi:hypothetical protein